MNVNLLSLATIQLPRRFRCPQSRYPARISCLTFDLFVTVQSKRNIVFLRIQACLFPTIASTGLNGSKTEASSNILSQTVTCKCEDKRRWLRYNRVSLSAQITLVTGCTYTRSIMNVSRPPRGATVAFRLLGEFAPMRPVPWDGLTCWAGPDRTADCWMNLDRRDPADPEKGRRGGSAGSGDNGMRRIPAAARTVCFGTGSGYFGTVP